MVTSFACVGPSRAHARPRLAALAALLAAFVLAAAPAQAQMVFTDGQAADGVLGQPDFITRNPTTTASGMNNPFGMAVDPTSGKLFVADYGNHRVLRFASASAFMNGEAAEVVLGQPDFTSSTAATTASGMRFPAGVAVDGLGRLFVADGSNNRVVRFDAAASKADGAAADGVLGQPDFNTVAPATTASGMNIPWGVAVDGAGRLFVGDLSNHRVLRFDAAASKADGAAADGVLGQPGFITSSPATTANGMNSPVGVAVDGAGRLFVAEQNNHRVVRFDAAASKADGAAADGVLGQPGFITSSPATTASGMGGPWGVAVDGAGRLFVAEFNNNRVVRFDAAASKANGAAADGVLGQPDFITSTAATTASGMQNPAAMAVDGAGRLFVADIFNHRVLRFTGPTPALPVASVTLDGAEGWRMLASPEATTVGAFLADLWTQGFTGADNPAGECTVFIFSEGAASFEAGWTCVTDATDALARGEGLMVFVYEDDDNDGTVTAAEAFPKTLSASAAIVPTGDFAFSVALTDDGRPLAQKGWNLLGAPFGTSLDWDAVVRTGVTLTVYVYDPAFGPSGGYRTYTSEGGTGSGDLPDGLVPPFQGFFVKAYTSSPALSLPEAGGTADGQDVYGRSTPTDPPLPPVAPVQSASVATDASGAPEGATALRAIAPNPTTGAATVAWTLAEAGAARVSVVDLLGREVAVLADRAFVPGSHRAEIPAGLLAPGVYVVRLQAGAVTEAARFSVVR